MESYNLKPESIEESFSQEEKDDASRQEILSRLDQIPSHLERALRIKNMLQLFEGYQNTSKSISKYRKRYIDKWKDALTSRQRELAKVI